MARYIFKRKIYNRLLQWKKKNGKTALLIEGAKGIGKSTIIKEFARNEYQSFIQINFSRAPKDIKNLFENLTDLDELFYVLQNSFHEPLIQRKSLIIFDEIQKFPIIRQAIKYLVEDGRYDYIEIGSFINIKKNTENIQIPNEEEKIQMFPMDFEEFHWALGDETTCSLLKTCWDNKHMLNTDSSQLDKSFRLYMLIGGMPQAVKTYLDTNDLSSVEETKRNIIQQYTKDFLEVDPTGMINNLYLAIPEQLNRNVSRYIQSSDIRSNTETKILELLNILEDSKTVNIAYHTNNPANKMKHSLNRKIFKIFVGDTGLFVTLALNGTYMQDDIIADKLLTKKLLSSFDYIYENLVAQMLVAGGKELIFHTWTDYEKHNYEINFILSQKNKICPIEVKSSGFKTHSVLDLFCKKFYSHISQQYLIYTKNLQQEQDGKTLLMPTYMTMFL